MAIMNILKIFDSKQFGFRFITEPASTDYDLIKATLFKFIFQQDSLIAFESIKSCFSAVVVAFASS